MSLHRYVYMYIQTYVIYAYMSTIWDYSGAKGAARQDGEEAAAESLALRREVLLATRECMNLYECLNF